MRDACPGLSSAALVAAVAAVPVLSACQPHAAHRLAMPAIPFSPAAHCVVTFNRKTKKMKPVTLTEVQIGSVDLFEDDFDTYDIVPVSVSGREH